MQTVLGILGTTHDPELRVAYGYPLTLVEAVLEDFCPDVVLGEVMPESWVHLRQDPSLRAPDFIEPPSEYHDLILPWVAARNIPFVPIDWCELDVWFELAPFARRPAGEREVLEVRLDQWDHEIRQTSKCSPIPFNGPEYDRRARAKYDWLASVDPAAYRVEWQVRNEIMAQRIRNAVRDYPGRRHLVIVGADHNYILADLLQEGEWSLVYPLRS